MAPSIDIKYDRLMKVKSLWKTDHFRTPKVLNIDTFTFPLDSIIHWFKVSQTIENPSSKYGYFKNNKILVETILKYPEEGTIGHFQYVSSPNAANIIKNASKEVKEFRWLNPQETIKLQPKVQIVYNYGALLSKYKYSEQILRRYNMYYNNVITMMDKLTLSKRNIFLVLDLPSKLMSKRELEKYSNKLTNAMLNNLPTTAHFNMIELWKLFNPAKYTSSLFATLPPYIPDKRDEIVLPSRPLYLEKSLWNRINLLLIIDTKCILVNLHNIMAYIEEWGVESKYIRPIKYKQFMVKFLDMLEYVIENAALTEEELEKSSETEDKENELEAKSVVSAQPAVVTKEPTIDSSTVQTDLELDDEDEINELFKENVGNLELPDIDKFDNNDMGTGEEYKDHDIDTETLTGIELKGELVLDNDFKDIDDLLKEEYKYDIVLDKIENMKSNKSISKKKYENLKKVIEEQPDKKVPYKDMKDVKLKDVLDDSKDKYSVEESDATITDNVSVLDKSYNKNTVNAINKEYIKDQYKKDIVRSVYALQNSDVVIEDYEIEELDSILGTIEEHTIKINSLNGSPSTIKINLPKISEDGEIKMSSNTYKMRAQKADVPIRKIDFNKVALSTYYGKLSVYKAKTNYDNIGYWLMNTIVKLTSTTDIKNLVLLPIKNPDVRLPLDYTHFSRFIKSFSFKGMDFLFDYANRGTLFKDKLSDEDIKDIEDDVVIVGCKGKDPIVMDFQNRLFILEGKKFKEIDNLYELLGIDKSTSPIEFITVNVIKKSIPAVIILAYYLGLEELFKLLKIKYELVDKKSRDIHKYNQYVVTFKDTHVILSRDFGKGDLILSGLLSIDKTLKEIPFTVFNDKSAYSVVFNKLNIPILYFNEIKLLETMFVDPMSLTLLKQMKEPTSFKGLLIRAAELLVDDNYKNSNSLDGMVIKGYERVAGLMYKELVTALKDHENRTFFSKSKVTVNPYSIMNKITEDSTTVLVDDLNPIAAIKQNEDVTMLGAFGRSKETLSKDTRGMHVSEVGVMSEAVKDNGDVGIAAYMSADPKLSNTRGMVDESKKNENWANLLSSSALLAPFALTDDVKRLVFSGIQNSHVIPINEMRVPYVRTGYESIIPIKAGDKFAITAEDSGVVLKVDKSSMKVKYDKKGEKSYKITSWTTKEESEACYTHVMVANLKEGDKFIKDDTLIYNSSFFEPDIFNKKRVLYKQGNLVTVALMEDAQTYEDSGAISKKLNTRLGTNITKVKSIVVNANDTIINMVRPGDKLEPNSTLFTITDSIMTNKKMDPEVLKTLENIKSKSPKAKVRGVVEKVVIMYNCEQDDLSDTLYELVKESDKRLKSDNGYTGRVNAGYSVRGVSLIDGQVEIKIYIRAADQMGIGDKAIFCNQLKFTVGDIFDSDIVSEDGTEIDATFAYRSINARIVNSATLIGTTSMVLEKLTEKVLDMYFK